MTFNRYIGMGYKAVEENARLTNYPVKIRTKPKKPESPTSQWKRIINNMKAKRLI